MKAKTGLLFLSALALAASSCEARRIKQGRLKPEEVMISYFSPQGSIQKPADLELQFSSPVAKNEDVGRDIDPAVISITPGLEKSCRWHNQSTVRCYLRGQAPELTYKLEVLKTILPAESKLKLLGRRNFAFSMAPLQALGIQTRFLSYTDPPRYGITVSFNQPVDPGEFSNRFKILAPDGKALPFTLRSWGPSEQLEVETYLSGYVRFKWNYLNLTVEPGLPNQARNSTLKQAFTKKIDLPIRGDLKITSSKLIQRENASLIQLCFSSAVSSDALQASLTISPSVDYHIENEGQCSDLVANLEPDQAYTISLKKGLVSSMDEELPNDFTDTLQMADLEPKISLVGSGHYLPRKGAMNLGLETINTEKVYIRVKKIYANNLAYFLAGGQDYYCGGYWDEESDSYHRSSAEECRLSRNLELLGKQTLEKEQAVVNVKNKIVTTPLALDDLAGKDRSGIYAVGIYKDKNSWYANAFAWMIATDLGILAQKSDDQLIVMVRSLETLEPQPGVRVKLLSKNNQVMAEQNTDLQGMAKFSNLETSFKEFVPLLILAEKGEDFSFLNFSQAGINTGSFDVSGDAYNTANYDAYLYPERDIYRPGETAHLAYLVRDAELGTGAAFPVTLKVTTPDNRLFKTLKSQPDELLSGEFAVSFPRELLTGAYSFELFGPEDKPIGSTAIKVEEFMPDRLKVVLTPDQKRCLAGESITASVKANYLFGPPVARQKASGNCYIEERPVSFPAYPEFYFGDELMKRLEPLNLSLGDQELDDNGEASFSCDIPGNLRPFSGSLSATIQVSVFEAGGGRAVTARKVLEVDPFEVYLGIRRDFKGEPGPKDVVNFSIMAVDPQGKPAPGRELNLRFYKLEWYSLLKLVNNRYEYTSELKQNLVKETKIRSGKDPVQVSFSSSSYGNFALSVEDAKSLARSSQDFYIWGWGYAPWAMAHPDRIELTLDKAEYLPGEDAKVLVKAPFSGKLIAMVMSGRMLDYREYTLTENTATLKIPVREDFKPNSYAVFILLRSFKNVEKFAPLRAVGIAPLKVSAAPRKLELKITAPKKIRPRTRLEVGIEVPSAPFGRVTLAAVDEGILQLTGFASPDPLGYYYRKRHLGYDLFDIYSMILPEVVPIAPRSPFGGEISRARLKRELAPLGVKRVKPVSLWSGLVKLDANGRAAVKFDVPQFNGRLRLMAVSFSREKMSGAESSVMVREPITITSSLPRFLAPGDSFVIPVTIFNGTGKAGEFIASIQTQGKVKLEKSSQKVSIEKDADATVRFNAEAVPATGADQIFIRVSGNGEQSSETTEIALRPPYPLYSKSEALSASESQTAKFKLPAGFVPGTQQFTIAASSMPALKYGGSLKYLVHYPYGCIEQTTSGVFPLLYFKDLARIAAPDLAKSGAVDYFVNQGIEKLVSMNMPEGQFSFWPDGGYPSCPWGSIYATNFLLEAKKAGYNVPEFILQRSVNYLWNFSSTHSVKEYWECDELAYSLYVLSLAGRPNSSVMDWMLKTNYCNGEEYLEPRTLLAGAYALKGDMQTANKLFPISPKPITTKMPMGRNWYTPARAYAITLNTLVEINPAHPAIPGLVKLLSGTAEGIAWHNTQENVFALLALGKYYRLQEQAGYKGVISIGKKAKIDFDPKGTTASSADWGGENVEVKITGKGLAYIYWEASGIPATPPELKAESSGIELTREYLDENGQAVALDKIPQGSIVIVRVKMRAKDQQVDNVVMADLLPAGLEIENPRLLTTARPAWIQEKTYKPDYMDIRDDRMLTFQTVFNYRNANEFGVFYYATRAVTAGAFVVPAVKAEAMYDPSFRAISEPGKMTIVERK